MQVVITARHGVTLTPEMKAHLEQKAEKLTKYYDRIQQIDVVVDREDSTYQVEAIVNAERNAEFVSRVSSKDVYAAMDSVVDKLERQISDFKERFRNRKHPTT